MRSHLDRLGGICYRIIESLMTPALAAHYSEQFSHRFSNSRHLRFFGWSRVWKILRRMHSRGPLGAREEPVFWARSFSKLSRVSGGILGFARYFCSCTTEKCENGCLDPSPVGDLRCPFHPRVERPLAVTVSTALIEASTNYGRVNVFTISIHEAMHVSNPNKPSSSSSL
jgi:hypothetical protein